MKTIAGIIITLTLFTPCSRAQLSWNWAQSGNVPTGGKITSNDIATDDAGNVYTCGAYRSDMNATTSIYIARYNSNGTHAWSKIAGTRIKDDVATGITIDQTGNVYVTGYYGSQNPAIDTDTAFFDTSFLISLGNASIFLAKYDPNGNLIWLKSIEASQPDAVNQSSDIKVDNSGYLYLTGTIGAYIQGTSISIFDTVALTSIGKGDFFLAKYDTSGHVIWARIAGGGNFDEGRRLDFDSIGNVYAIGQSQSPLMYFGSVQLNWISSGNHGNDLFIVKYDKNGNVLWANPIGIVANGGGPTAPMAYLLPLNISATNDGRSVYTVGSYAHGGIRFHSGLILPNFGNARDMFVTRYDTNGQLVWAKKAGGTGDDAARDIAIDNNDGVYVTGYYSGKIGFGSDTLQYMGGEDIFITRYDTSGNVTWATSVAGPGLESASGISVNPSGNTLFIGGQVNAPLNFGVHTVNTSASSNYFVAKASLTTGINPFNVPEKDILLYPNPTTGILQVSDPSGKHLSVQLFDVLGRQVYQQAGKQKAVLDITHLPDGVYFLQCTGAGTFLTKKIILQR